MPHRWLARHGLTNETWDAEALKDGDEDRQPAWEEYIADTDPTNRASVFEIFRMGGEATRSITFVSSTARVYTVQYAAEASGTGAWANLVSAWAGSNRLTTVTDTNAAPFRLYRIGVSKP